MAGNRLLREELNIIHTNVFLMFHLIRIWNCPCNKNHIGGWKYYGLGERSVLWVMDSC